MQEIGGSSGLSASTVRRRGARINKMKTSEIHIFYSLTQKEVIPPAERELARKDNWLKEIQKTIEADWKPLIVKVSYRLFNPEIEKQRRFFQKLKTFEAIHKRKRYDKK